jgi:hypothetical protein
MEHTEMWIWSWFISVQDPEGRDYFVDLVILEWSIQKCGFGLGLSPLTKYY